MCFIPIQLKTGDFVPCSRCYQCRKKYAEQWAFRLQQERKVSASSYFITLTYDQDNIPYGNKGYVLYYPDFKNYIKRLRRIEKNPYIKYFVVGEKGDKLDRVHWHAMLFNVQAERNITIAWRGKGFVTTSEATDGRMIYILKYLTKDSDQTDGRDYLVHMSKGIGKDYLTKEIKRFHLKKMRNYVTVKGGFKKPLPRYYKERIFTTQYQKDQIRIQAIKYNMEREERNIDLEHFKIRRWEQNRDIAKERKMIINIKN